MIYTVVHINVVSRSAASLGLRSLLIGIHVARYTKTYRQRTPGSVKRQKPQNQSIKLFDAHTSPTIGFHMMVAMDRSMVRSLIHVHVRSYADSDDKS
jgi:hypothetical protein